MKLLILFLLACTLQTFGQNGKGFEIVGQITNAEGKKIYVAPTVQAISIDSTIIKNGTFILKGRIKEPDYFALIVEGKAAYAWFILSNDKLKFKGNADSMRQANISGSKELRDAQKLRAIIKPYFAYQSASFDSAFSAYNRGDSIKGMQYEKMNLSISKIINDSIAQFIKAHPTSYISLAQLNELQKTYSANKAKKLFLSLSPVLQNHSIGKQLKYQIFEAGKLTALNQNALAFQQMDTANTVVHLADYKGKYVLIDFWASWCMPCRAENPNIKKAYSRFQSKGFDVLGVSLDNNKEAWKKALIKDDLPWINVSDLKGFKNAVAQQYAVTELPTNYLLDPMGKIIAKNLKGDDLIKKLLFLLGE